MSVMYFRVDENKVGLVVNTADRTGEFKTVESESDKAAINALFDAMKKQVYQGEFEILLPQRQG